MLSLHGSASISRCWVSYKKTGLGRSPLKKYSSGRVEIWKELSEKDYYVSITLCQLKKYSELNHFRKSLLLGEIGHIELLSEQKKEAAHRARKTTCPSASGTRVGQQIRKQTLYTLLKGFRRPVDL
jgi:hypothetical protein